jgi:hypothetical protein
MSVRGRCYLLCILAPVLFLLGGCGVGECGGAGGVGDVCPPPLYGHAEVTGRALRSDWSPLAGKQVYVSCGDVIGGLDDITDAEGRFDVRLGYGVADTVLYPFPPRNLDGSFEVSCNASLRLPGDVVLRQDAFVVRFMPKREAVVPTVVELRESVAQAQR